MFEDIRKLVGGELTDDEAKALAEWYASLARGVAGFPAQDLRTVEPPLHSIPAPKQPAP